MKDMHGVIEIVVGNMDVAGGMRRRKCGGGGAALCMRVGRSSSMGRGLVGRSSTCAVAVWVEMSRRWVGGAAAVVVGASIGIVMALGWALWGRAVAAGIAVMGGCTRLETNWTT
jgi:hypothetical protein